MRLKVNGEEREVDDGTTVAGLVALLALKPERVAVEKNQLVVRRATWAEAPLADGDVVEILTFVGGG